MQTQTPFGITCAGTLQQFLMLLERQTKLAELPTSNDTDALAQSSTVRDGPHETAFILCKPFFLRLETWLKLRNVM